MRICYTNLWAGAACLILAALPARDGQAQEPVPVDHNYYVTYWCPEWKQTATMDSDAAEDLADRLRSFGAEVRFVGKGVAVDDPEYPTAAFRLESVKYRLTTPARLVTPDPWQARRWQTRLRRFGFEVRLTVDEPYTDFPPPPVSGGAPSDKGPAGVRFRAHTVWTGSISQEGELLPARLVLDRDGDRLTGELSFRQGDHPYRAKVRGTVRGNAVSFTTYEAIEGRVYVPCEYRAVLTGATMKGTWHYAPEQLEDDFQFVQADE